MDIKVSIDQHETYTISENEESILLNGNVEDYQIKKTGRGQFIFYRNVRTYLIRVIAYTSNHLTLNINGKTLNVTIKDHITQILERLGMDMDPEPVIEGINAPMPGTILEVAVKQGDQVKKGDKLIILEAMKMENVIKAPVDGEISMVAVNQGENVEKNQRLLSF